MSGKRKSLKSKHLLLDSTKLSVPSNNRLFDHARPPFRPRRNSISKTKPSPSRRESIRRRNSFKDSIPLAERVRKYQQEAGKQKDASVQRSGYQENIPINERISIIEKKLSDNYRKPISPIATRKRNEKYSLRVASPERALELARKYFNNPNPKRRT